MKTFIIGGIIALTGLWGGAWAFEALKTSWMHFPAFVTAFIMFMAGAVLVIKAIVFITEAK